MSLARKRLLGIGAIATTAIVALAGCTATDDGSNGGDAGPSTDTIRTSLTTDPTTFDAAKANAKDDYQVARYLFDTVLRLDEEGTFAGGLASEWDATADQATLTI